MIGAASVVPLRMDHCASKPSRAEPSRADARAHAHPPHAHPPPHAPARAWLGGSWMRRDDACGRGRARRGGRCARHRERADPCRAERAEGVAAQGMPDPSRAALAGPRAHAERGLGGWGGQVVLLPDFASTVSREADPSPDDGFDTIDLLEMVTATVTLAPSV